MYKTHKGRLHVVHQEAISSFHNEGPEASNQIKPYLNDTFGATFPLSLHPLCHWPGLEPSSLPQLPSWPPSLWVTSLFWPPSSTNLHATPGELQSPAFIMQFPTLKLLIVLCCLQGKSQIPQLSLTALPAEQNKNPIQSVNVFVEWVTQSRSQGSPCFVSQSAPSSWPHLLDLGHQCCTVAEAVFCCFRLREAASRTGPAG